VRLLFFEQVEAGLRDRAVFAVFDWFLFGGEQRRLVGVRVGAGEDQPLVLGAFDVAAGFFPAFFGGFERLFRRLLSGPAADHLLGADQVRLPVVEIELGGRPHLFGGAFGVGHARQRDHDVLVPDACHFRLGDAELVDPLFDDRDRVFDVFAADLGRGAGRLAFVDQLEAALEVEPELRFLRSDDHRRDRHQPEHEQQDEDVPAA